jgi:DNA-binding MarR family transcriptional regulator
MNLTELQKKCFHAIGSLIEEETGNLADQSTSVTVTDIAEKVRMNATAIRGVIGSLSRRKWLKMTRDKINGLNMVFYSLTPEGISLYNERFASAT